MPTLKQTIFASMLVFALLSTVAAQEKPAAQGALPTIIASASGERVRITGPSSIVQMRLEVFNGGGEKLFDQEIRGGNVFDWHLQDGQGQRLAAGTYVCVVTAKSSSGKLTQKIGTVNVAEKSMNVQTAAPLSAPQAQTIGPVEENSSWIIAGMDDPQTPTVIAHDGTDGQMIRGRGALTFRIGNFFSGVDTEQMRLTEAGDLGIGTSEPKSKLDVAGTIRAARFLVAKPKTGGTDKTAADSQTTLTISPDSSDFQPLIAGAGSQNRIAKWTDNAGTLGDSGITETAGGLVGIGTTTPDSKLVVSSNSAALPPAIGTARFADADGGQTAVFADAFSNNAIFNVRRANGTAAAPSALQANQLVGVIGASGYGASAYMGTRARVAFWASENWTNTANGTYLTFNTTANGAATPGGAERMRIDNAGNVGIGTSNPGTTLDVQNSVGSALIRARSISSGGGVLFLDRAAAVPSNSSQIGFYTAGSPDFTMGTSQGSAGNSDLSVYNYGTGSNALTILKSNSNVGIGTTGPGAALEVRRDSTIASDWQTGQMRLSGASNPNMQLSLGYDTSSNLGVIQAGQAFTAFRNLSLNPFGGNVGIGTTSPTSKLEVQSTGTSIYGQTQSSSGVGVGGYASAGSGFTRGVYGQSDSSGGYGLHGYSPGGVGVVGTTLSGIAVSAQGSGGNSTALEVKNGAIKVNGASPPVFVLTVHAGVNTCLSGQAISIDSPYSNNNPNAIILVTFSTVGQFFPVSLPTVFVAYFNSDVGGCPGHFWLIRNTDASALQDNLRLNVMIIDP